MIIGILGGGSFPSRLLRSYTRKPSPDNPLKQRNLPYQAIGLSLYEELAGTSVEAIGKEVVRTQWLDDKAFKKDRKANNNALLGKNIIIVDEVDDSRMTLQYAYQELVKDVRNGLESLSEEERGKLPPTRFGIFVVHNKVKAEGKKGHLPLLDFQTASSKLEDQPIVDGIGQGVWYYSAEEVGDVWVDYPWEAQAIEEHDRLAILAKELGVNQGRK